MPVAKGCEKCRDFDPTTTAMAHQHQQQLTDKPRYSEPSYPQGHLPSEAFPESVSGEAVGQYPPAHESKPAGRTILSNKGPQAIRTKEAVHMAQEDLRRELAQTITELEEISVKAQEKVSKDPERLKEIQSRGEVEAESLKKKADDLHQRLSTLGADVERQQPPSHLAPGVEREGVIQSQPSGQSQHPQPQPQPAADSGTSKPEELGRELRRALSKAKHDAQQQVSHFGQLASHSKEAFSEFVEGFMHPDEVSQAQQHQSAAPASSAGSAGESSSEHHGGLLAAAAAQLKETLGFGHSASSKSHGSAATPTSTTKKTD